MTQLAYAGATNGRVVQIPEVEWRLSDYGFHVGYKLGFIKSWRDRIVLASGKSNYYISKILNQFWNATAYSFPGTLYFCLWTATLSAASTGSTAGEAAYTGYGRVAVTANTTNFPASAGGSNIQNGTAITWGANSGGGAETETYVQVNDASSAGNSLMWGSISSTVVNVGDTPQVNINGLTATEA